MSCLLMVQERCTDCAARQGLVCPRLASQMIPTTDSQQQALSDAIFPRKSSVLSATGHLETSASESADYSHIQCSRD